MTNTIPKNIFQIWITTTNNKIPENWIPAKQSIMDNNIDWNYHLINNDTAIDITTRYFPDFLQYYLHLKHDVQRADAIRYILLYLYGGIYIDLDFASIQSFNNIHLDDDKEIGFIPSPYSTTAVTNSFIVAKPYSTFFLLCIKEMKKYKPIWAVTSHLEILNTTGPSMINNVIKKYNYDDKIQVLKNVSVPCDPCNFKKCVTSDDYIIMPIKGKVWNKWDSHLINYVYCNYTIIVFILFFILIVILTITCTRTRRAYIT